MNMSTTGPTISLVETTIAARRAAGGGALIGYLPVTDAEAMDSLRLLSRTEGIIPAIESAHALAGTLELGKKLGPDSIILVNLSGRGDKDMETAGRYYDLLDAGAQQL